MRARLLTLSAALLAAACGGDQVIGIGQGIHHDDFEYSVQSLERKDRIGNLHAHGLFYVVTFEVRNGAKQVEHKWSNGIAYVVDRQGRHYEVDADAQQALAVTRPFQYKDRYVTPAGATESTVLVFDLPTQIEEPYLGVRGLFMLGDLKDFNQYRRKRVRLF
jgi:hypothetical protein